MCQPRQANIFFEVVAEKLIICLFLIWEEFFKSVNCVRQEGPAILISRWLLRMLPACVASFVWTSTKNEWNSSKAICDHARSDLASHAGVFRGARISSLPTNACSTQNNIPFPRLANHVVLSKFWKVDLDRRVTR